MESKYDIFISYSSSDKDKVDFILNELVGNLKFSPIVSELEREAGKPLAKKVAEEINRAKIVVPILTSESYKSQWINQEIGFAASLGKRIYAIVETNLISDLKGFVHKEVQLPYNYTPNMDKEIENKDFAKQVKKLFSDLEQKPQLLEPIESQPTNGILSMQLEWNGQGINKLIQEQQELFIFLKDGYKFFSNRSAELLERVQKKGLITKIMILHPDYEYLNAVAAMDPNKKDNPIIQKNDCIKAIKTMQEIRANIKNVNGYDISSRVTFLGYRTIPTWNGHIGNEHAIIHLYPTMPHRRNLQTMEIVAKDINKNNTDWYEYYRTEYLEIERLTKSNFPNNCNLWEYDIS